MALTQEELAEKAGVALTVIRKIEQDKENLSLSKVNQVLMMFGHVVGPVKATSKDPDALEPFEQASNAQNN